MKEGKQKLISAKRALLATVVASVCAHGASGSLIDFLKTPSTSGIVSGGALLPMPGGMGFRLDWAISDNLNGTFHYIYTFSDENGNPFVEPSPAITSIMLELSDDISSTDLFNFVGVQGLPEFETFQPSAQHPGLPGPLFGVKFEVDNVNNGTQIEFDSNRFPHWADFWVRAGPFQDGNFAHNTDFGVAVLNPNDFNAPSALDLGGQPIFKILAPNSVIPEPGTVALLGLAGFLSSRGRRRRRSSAS